MPQLQHITLKPGQTGFHGYLLAAVPKYEATWRYGKEERVIAWTSGGYGIMMSRPCLTAIIENWRKFRDSLPGQMFHHANDVETGALLTFLGYKPTLWKSNALKKLAMAPEFVANNLREQAGILSAHYVWPMRAISLTQWAQQRKLRALANANDLPGLYRFASNEIDMMAEVLRRKMIDVRFTYELMMLKNDTRTERLRTWKWVEVPSALHPQEPPDEEEVYLKRLQELDSEWKLEMGPHAVLQKKQ